MLQGYSEVRSAYELMKKYNGVEVFIGSTEVPLQELASSTCYQLLVAKLVPGAASVLVHRLTHVAAAAAAAAAAVPVTHTGDSPIQARAGRVRATGICRFSQRRAKLRGP